jgi:hypothetical protein
MKMTWVLRAVLLTYIAAFVAGCCCGVPLVSTLPTSAELAR